MLFDAWSFFMRLYKNLCLFLRKKGKFHRYICIEIVIALKECS